MTGTHTSSLTDGLGTTTLDGGGSAGPEGGGSKVDALKETGSDLTHAATEKAGDVAHKVADKADDRRTELAKTARTLQEKAEAFAQEISFEQPQVGHALEEVASKAGQAISYVETTPVEQMSQDLKVQAQRHPLIFAAGMFGAGFALLRAFKPVDRPVERQGQLTEGGQY